jgi:hypothetical protein
VAAVVDVLERIVAEPGEAAGRPVHLLGNSLGGLVSLFVAPAARPGRHPDPRVAGDAGLPRAGAFSRTLLLLLLPGSRHWPSAGCPA